MHAVVEQGAPGALMGGVVGACVGWGGVMWGHDAMGAALFGARAYQVLYLLVPGALVASARLQPRRVLPRRDAVIFGVGSGLLAATMGTILFLIVAVQVPAVFAGVDATERMFTVRAAVGWTGWGMLSLLAALTGGIVGGTTPAGGPSRRG